MEEFISKWYYLFSQMFIYLFLKLPTESIPLVEYIYIYSYLCSEIFMQLVKIDNIKTNYK